MVSKQNFLCLFFLLYNIPVRLDDVETVSEGLGLLWLGELLIMYPQLLGPPISMHKPLNGSCNQPITV
mgnify:CR=1 FL=1